MEVNCNIIFGIFYWKRELDILVFRFLVYELLYYIYINFYYKIGEL